MPSAPLDYQSPEVLSPRRSKSAIVSIVASSLALAAGLGAYRFMVDKWMAGLVLFLICAPVFVVAAIAALVSGFSGAKRKGTLVLACSLLLIQGVLWTWFIVAELVHRAPYNSGGAGGF